MNFNERDKNMEKDEKSSATQGNSPELFGWFYELSAIRDEPNLYRKLTMLKDYEAKHGVLSPQQRARLGISSH